MGRVTPALLWAAAAAAALAFVALGCSERAEPAVRLVDGTTPPPLPAALEETGRGSVVSRVTVTSVRRLGAAGRRCVDGFRPEFRVAAGATVVRRTGVVGESLTFADVAHDVVLGCDRVDRRAPASDPWCGRSVGRLVAGRLRDLRLDIACRTGGAAQVGFGWVQAGAGTRWVGARAGSATEIAVVAAGLPVRVVANDVDADTSSATFAISEYAASGNVLRSYRVSAGVAG
jgi:hypothetical protein